jgi:IS605 OrfB family transposase
VENKLLSPSLILKRKKAYLAVPFKVSVCGLKCPEKKVCSADLGSRTNATAVIVSEDGTVTARKFISCAADMDRRDRRLKLVSQKASLTNGQLCSGFARQWYRKASVINEEIAQKVSGSLVKFALDNQAEVIVCEHLKGWRPRGGKKGSTLRQRFHGWLHKRIVRLVEEKFSEKGGQVVLVSPRGTSKFAYDGSGVVKRDKKNASKCMFATGKEYNSDLSASYNIGARYWAQRLGCGNSTETLSGRSTRNVPRMPVTLSSLWKTAGRKECEAATTPVTAG